MRSKVEMSNGGRLPEEQGGDEQWGRFMRSMLEMSRGIRLHEKHG